MNKCDLEELRHSALQQILESATTTPEKWVKGKNREYDFGETWVCGKFTLRHQVSVGSTYNEAYFGGEHVGTAMYCWRATYSTPEFAQDVYKAFSEHPAAKAYDAIQKYQQDRQREAACQRLAKAMSIDVAPPEEKLALEPPYHINNGYDPQPNNLWKRLKAFITRPTESRGPG